MQSGWVSVCASSFLAICAHEYVNVCALGLCSDFGEFLKVVEKQKERAAMFDDESDMSTCVDVVFFFDRSTCVDMFSCASQAATCGGKKALVITAHWYRAITLPFRLAHIPLPLPLPSLNL
jgi:hypothetical protein